MAILKCKMCGGTLDYDQGQNLAVCPYCGSKSTVFDQDRKLFEQFQSQFAALLDQNQKPAPEDGFWVESSKDELIRADGAVIEISFLTKRKTDLCTMYVAKRNIIYLFEEEHAEYASRYQEMVKNLRYPSPEMERRLSEYIPKLVTECRLADGSIFLAIEKRKGTYPLKMLGTLLHRHVAWIISRLENLCCLLDYNNMVLNALTADNLFVDPANHQIYLYGGWWFAGYEGAEVIGASKSVIPYLGKAKKLPGIFSQEKKSRYTARTDLESIRLTAAKLLGFSGKEALGDYGGKTSGLVESGLDSSGLGASGLDSSSSEVPAKVLFTETFQQNMLLPEPFRLFLLKSPERDALADFAKWDQILEASYGERKFIPLPITEEEIYSRSGGQE